MAMVKQIVLPKGAAGTWDDVYVASLRPVYDAANNRYIGYYVGLDDLDYLWESGLASSAGDQNSFVKGSSNPVTFGDAQGWENGKKCIIPSILFDITTGLPVQYDGKYWLAYFCDNAAASTSYGIGFSYATNLAGPWTKYAANPIITKGGVGEWDVDWIRMPHLCYDPGDGKYYLFYQGTNDAGTTWNIGLASAAAMDGVWAKDGGNPVLSGGIAWESNKIQDPALFKIGATYYLFYTGGANTSTQYNGFATAAAIGGAYTKSTSNPVTHRGTSNPFITKVGSTYYQYVDNHYIDSINTRYESRYLADALTRKYWKFDVAQYQPELDNNMFALAPGCAQDVADMYTGNFPLYNGESAPSVLTATLNAFGAGEGFDATNGYIIFNKTNHTNITLPDVTLVDTAQPFVFEAYLYCPVAQMTANAWATIAMIKSNYIGDKPFGVFITNWAGYGPFVWGNNTEKASYGTAPDVSVFDRWVHIMINNTGSGWGLDKWRVFIDGYEMPVSASAPPAAYTNENRIGNNSGNYAFPGYIRWMALYQTNMYLERYSNNSNRIIQTPAMDYYGYDNGDDTMALETSLRITASSVIQTVHRSAPSVGVGVSPALC